MRVFFDNNFNVMKVINKYIRVLQKDGNSNCK